MKPNVLYYPVVAVIMFPEATVCRSALIASAKKLSGDNIPWEVIEKRLLLQYNSKNWDFNVASRNEARRDGESFNLIAQLAAGGARKWLEEKAAQVRRQGKTVTEPIFVAVDFRQGTLRNLKSNSGV